MRVSRRSPVLLLKMESKGRREGVERKGRRREGEVGGRGKEGEGG